MALLPDAEALARVAAGASLSPQETPTCFDQLYFRSPVSARLHSSSRGQIAASRRAGLFRPMRDENLLERETGLCYLRFNERQSPIAVFEAGRRGDRRGPAGGPFFLLAPTPPPPPP